LRIQVSQRGFEHLPVTGILGSLQLLEDPLPRQQDSLPLSLQPELFQALPGPFLSAIRQHFGLLLLDGLALPASGHRETLYVALACRGCEGLNSGRNNFLSWVGSRNRTRAVTKNEHHERNVVYD